MEILGLLLPVIVDVINKALKVTDSNIRLIISVVICSIVGIVLSFFQSNGFHYADIQTAGAAIGQSIILVFGFAQLSFQGYWRNTDSHKEISQQ